MNIFNEEPFLIAEIGVNYYDIAKKENISNMEAAIFSAYLDDLYFLLFPVSYFLQNMQREPVTGLLFIPFYTMVHI